MSIGCVTKKYGHNEVLLETALVYFDKFLTASNARRARAKGFPHVCFPRRGKLPPQSAIRPAAFRPSLCWLCRRGRHRAGLEKNGAKMPVRELRTGRLTCY